MGFELPKRKTWNKKEYALRAKEKKERQEKEMLNMDLDLSTNASSKLPKRLRGTIIRRSDLQPHDWDKVDVKKYIGKRQLISDETPENQKGAWYCEECKCHLHTSHMYLDHMNSKKHQHMRGMSMRPKNSTLQQVKNRLAMHGKRSRNEFEEEMDVVDRIELRKKKEKRQKELKKQAKKRRKLAKKQARKDEEYGKEGIDPEMAAMGFTFSFGGSKKS